MIMFKEPVEVQKGKVYILSVYRNEGFILTAIHLLSTLSLR